jgi:hypothetical protein
MEGFWRGLYCSPLTVLPEGEKLAYNFRIYLFPVVVVALRTTVGAPVDSVTTVGGGVRVVVVGDVVVVVGG